MNELHTYDSGSQSPYLGYNGRGDFFPRFKRSSFYWPGSATAKKVFQVNLNLPFLPQATNP